MAKYVIVVGGVYSGAGKGISAASLALLLKMRDVKVNLIKCDPYLNSNAGTMNPKQHGEVFLCEDGSETDLDLGHYERLTDIPMSKNNIFTSGVINKEILEEEERGDYLGDTVQVIPHVTDKIHKKLLAAGQGHDVLVAEIGGTVGDFESAALYESIRQFKLMFRDDVIIVMVAPIILNHTVNELKTKPLQNAVRSLLSAGIQPEMLLCRCETKVHDDLLDKISRLTNVDRSAVFEAPDVETIYKVPIEFHDRNVDDLIVDRFRLPRNGFNIKKYRNLVEKYLEGRRNGTLKKVNVAVVGKYTNHDEAYKSLSEALFHAAVANKADVTIDWISAEFLEEDDGKIDDLPYNWHGVIVPGGFDKRGVKGKMKAIKFCREKKIPFLGICLGLQCAVIEFAQNVMRAEGANSQEFEADCSVPVVHFVDGQSAGMKKSGTMRLGAYDCELEKDTIVRELYKKKLISERHRHRLEVNGQYVQEYASKGFVVSGKNPNTGLVEMMELKKDIHPFFVGTQAHPEFKSRLGDPAPLFDGLVKAAVQRLDNNDGQV